MTSFLRLLEDWSTHQDYVWFLALLAWGGVIAAEIRRGENGRIVLRNGWLVALAAGCAVGALAELTLLAQRLMTPYTTFDAVMGAAEAAGAAALAWHACAGLARAATLRRLTIAACVAFAGARIVFPVPVGYGLALAQALALWAIVRRSPGTLPTAVVAALAFAPIIATHGPWASALTHGRKITDWSHFALAAALTSLLAGASLAAQAWRRRLRETVPDLTRGTELHRDLRRATACLAVWLITGVLLAVWYGRLARRSFEENLLRRAEICVAALDPKLISATLVPELKITALRREFYPDGRPVDVATIPHTREPVYTELRAQLVRLREANADLFGLYIATRRQGHVLALSSSVRATPSVRHVLLAPSVYPADQVAPRAHIQGPTYSPAAGSKVIAHAPLFHPQTKETLGWLALETTAAHWMATFVQARLQTMALVAAGVGLWVVVVAYRLRREGRDVAERKARDAAAADRAKSAFLAKVSHELRTPIQSVLGYGELLATGPLVEPHRSFLTALRSHGDIMLRLVNDLIDLGALQSGAFRLEVAPVNLTSIVHDCAAALRPAAGEKGLHFHVELTPDLPEWVSADGVRLRQVLLNLLTNAVKFTRAGKIALHVRWRDAAVEFEIADTGPGIPVAQRARLFQPFARLDPAASGGSGLGLALVRGLCGAMGGEVFLADSTAGSTFVVRLPLAPCAAPDLPEAPAAVEHTSIAGLRVVLAEDNTLVRELLVAFLAEQGARTSIAIDGPAALALVRQNSPDVLLLDIALPGLDGIAVAETLRHEGPAGLRIVGLSAHATHQDEERARAAGMDEFLTKPVRLSELARVLARQPRSSSAPVREPTDPMLALRARLAEQFASETPQVLEAMRVAFTKRDWRRLRERAHYLKNSADIINASALQAACRRMCDLAEHAAAEEVASLLADIEAAVPAHFFVLADARATDRP